MANKPNVLFIVADHFRKEALGHFGENANTTPNLDRFVESDAMSFENAYCQNPVCVPSRCSFMTGRYPHVGGYRTMHHLLDDSSFNLLSELKHNGYYVYFGGKNDLFKREVDKSYYCDYRSNAFEEYNCRLADKPIDKDLHHLLDGYDTALFKEAENAKTESRHEADSKYYYSLYQGVVDDPNPFKVGYTGLEDVQISNAIDFITKYPDDKPLFMYLSLMLPHPHYAASAQDYNQIDRSKIKPPIRLSELQRDLKPSILEGMRTNHRLAQWDDDELLSFKQTYYAMVAHCDRNFQKVMDALKAKGMYDDTIVVVFSDHGDYAGEYEVAEINQNTFDDFLTNVPLIIKPQKGVNYVPGIKKGMVELLDIPKTIADLTEIKLSESDFGRSFVPAFMDNNAHLRDYVYCEGGRLNYEKHCTDGGHSPSNLYWARTSVQERMPEHTKAVMIRDDKFKYVYRLYEKDEFYDLSIDPYEKDNRIDDSQYVDEIERLKHNLLDYYVETCDVVPKKRDER